MTSTTGGGVVSRYHEIYVHQSQPRLQQHPTNPSSYDEIETANVQITAPLPPPYQQTLLSGGRGLVEQDSSTLAAETQLMMAPLPRRGDPPSYQEAIDPDAPPPSYDSLFGRVREARKTSTGLVDFAKNILILLLGTLGCTIILGVTIVIPVCMIIFGVIFMKECPQNEYIPVYLLVGGGFGVIKLILHLLTFIKDRDAQEAERMRQSPTQQLLNCFMLGWFIIGSFWIYKEYEPNYDPAKGKYCHRSLYMFSFWLITSVYITLGLITLGLCSITIGSIWAHRNS